MPSEFRNCIGCGSEFEITEGEQSFYNSKTDDKGQTFSLPKRCKACRLKKRSEGHQVEAAPEGHHMDFRRAKRWGRDGADDFEM